MTQSTAAAADSVPKRLNLTPHELIIYDPDGVTKRECIPSAGELRLLSGPGVPVPTDRRVSQPTPSDYAIPVVPAQEFIGLDAQGVGYEWFTALRAGFDAAIVSLPVAQFLVAQPEDKRRALPLIYTPATGPATVVRDAERKIAGVIALELHFPK